MHKLSCRVYMQMHKLSYRVYIVVSLYKWKCHTRFSLPRNVQSVHVNEQTAEHKYPRIFMFSYLYQNLKVCKSIRMEKYLSFS